MFLSLFCAFLFFLDFELSELSAFLGAAVWAFSTYMLFWNGWSVGMSTASFPLLLLGLRRIARGAPPGFGLAVLAFVLSLIGGHPESVLHSAAAGGVYFLWELSRRERRAWVRGLRSAAGAALLAFLLAGPMLLPLLEAIPHSAEYRARQAALASSRARPSVSVAESARRLLPAVLPFAHGIYGKSLVQDFRADGSGMPLAYSGSIVFPLALLSLFSRDRSRPERFLFLAFVLVGLLMGASAPGLMDLLAGLPGFRLALNYRLVFLTAIGFAGLAALGADRIERTGSRGRLSVACLVASLFLAMVLFASRGVVRERSLPGDFVRASFLAELVPLLLLAAVSLVPGFSFRSLAAVALFLFAAGRVLEMGGVYPTLPATTLAPALPTLSALSGGERPYRVVATGETLRPNGATLYGLEDVRGYESIVLDRFADTFPLWCRPQFASFTRVDDLDRPFLSFLGVRYAIAPPDAKPSRGWDPSAAGKEMSVFANPRALARAFVPQTVRHETDPIVTLEEMQDAGDFSKTAWVQAAGASAAKSEANGPATLQVRDVGPDLAISADCPGRVLVVTSLPDWPGWVAKRDGGGGFLPTVTVNHAFVGLWLAPGHTSLRLTYRPRSFQRGLWAFALGLVATVTIRLRVGARASSP
jgi:hypothetical protein